MVSDVEKCTTKNDDESKLSNHSETYKASSSTDNKVDYNTLLGDHEENRMFHWWEGLGQSKNDMNDETIFHDLRKKELLNILNWAHTNPMTKQTNKNKNKNNDNNNNNSFQFKLDGISLLHLPTPTPSTNDQLRFLIQCAQQKKIPNNSLDFTAIMALGLALQESLTASLIPLAISHVNRCQSLTTDTSPVIDDQHNNRKRKCSQSTNNNTNDNKKPKEDFSSSELSNNIEKYDDTHPFHEWTLPYIEAIHKLIPATIHNESKKSGDNIECFRTSPSFLPSSMPASHQYNDENMWKWSHVEDFYECFSSRMGKKNENSKQSDKRSNTQTNELREVIDHEISWTLSDIKTLYKINSTKKEKNSHIKTSQNEDKTDDDSKLSSPPLPSFSGRKETEVDSATRWCKARGFHPDFVSQNCDLFSLFLNQCPK